MRHLLTLLLLTSLLNGCNAAGTKSNSLPAAGATTSANANAARANRMCGKADPPGRTGHRRM